MNNNISTNKDINASVDLFKFIAAFFVISIHSQPFYGTQADYYYNCLAVAAVPFFFCISSYFFFLKNADIKKYLKRMSTLYITWFIIELPFVYLRFRNYPTTSECITSFTKGLLLQNTFYASWFLTASIESILLVYVFNKYLGKLKSMIAVLAIYIVGLAGSMYSGVVLDLPQGHTIVEFLKNICASQSFIVAVPYVWIGMLIAKHGKINYRLKNLQITLLLIVILGASEAYLCKNICYGKTVSLCMPLFIFYLSNLALSLNVSISNKISMYLRISSILLYLIHPVVILVLNHFMHIPMGGVLFLLTTMITVIISFSIVLLSNRYVILRHLY